jgi:hypothetical protein
MAQLVRLSLDEWLLLTLTRILTLLNILIILNG